MELNPYAPPAFGAERGAPRSVTPVPIPGDLEAMRLARLRAEQWVRVASGVWGTLGAGCLLLALISGFERHTATLFAVALLAILGVSSIAGAFWLHALRPSGRILASIFGAMCVVPAAMLILAAGVHDPPIGLRVCVFFGTPIAAVLSLWFPPVSAVFRDEYREQIVPATPHLSSAVPVTVGMMLGLGLPFAFVAWVVG